MNKRWMITTAGVLIVAVVGGLAAAYSYTSQVDFTPLVGAQEPTPIPPDQIPPVDWSQVIYDLAPPGTVQSVTSVVRLPDTPEEKAAREAEKRKVRGPSVGGVHIGSFPSREGDRFLHFDNGQYVALPTGVEIDRVTHSIDCWHDDCPTAMPVYELERGGATITIQADGIRYDWEQSSDDPNQFEFLWSDRRNHP